MPDHDEYPMSEPDYDDDNKTPPDPRFPEWDSKSRAELRQRLYDAVTKRCEAMQELLLRVIPRLLRNLGITLPGSTEDGDELDEEVLEYMKYMVSDEVIAKTHEAINEQIELWKGLRHWRFSGKNPCDSWRDWFKKAKCWQDQNQHKPLGKFWCLVLGELKQYTLNIAKRVYPSPDDQRKKQALHQCLFAKCVEAILTGCVRFEKTRKTPLLPVRALAQSKELQKKLQSIDNGFILTTWKQQAETIAKKRKQDSHGQKARKSDKGKTTAPRSNVATLMNEKCAKHATNVFRRSVRSLKQTIPTLNIDFAAIEESIKLEAINAETTHKSSTYPPSSWNGSDDSNRNHSRSRSNSNSQDAETETPSIAAPTINANTSPVLEATGYGATRGMNQVLRAKAHRYSPTVSGVSSAPSTSDVSSVNDAASIGSHGSLSDESHRSPRGRRSTHDHSRRSRHSREPRVRTRAYTDEYGIQDRNTENDSSTLNRLSVENEELRRQLDEIKRELGEKRANFQQQSLVNSVLQAMQFQNESFHRYMMGLETSRTPPTVAYPPYFVAPPPPLPAAVAPHPPSHDRSYPAQQPLPAAPPTTVPPLPSSVMLNDGHGGQCLYNPPQGTMYHFPSKSFMDSNSNSNSNNSNNNNDDNHMILKPAAPNTVDMDQIINHRQMNIDILPDASNPHRNASVSASTSANAMTSQPGMTPRVHCACESPQHDQPILETECTPQISGVSSSSFDTVFDDDNQTQPFFSLNHRPPSPLNIQCFDSEYICNWP